MVQKVFNVTDRRTDRHSDSKCRVSLRCSAKHAPKSLNVVGPVAVAVYTGWKAFVEQITLNPGVMERSDGRWKWRE